MKNNRSPTPQKRIERTELLSRLRLFYKQFNQGDWHGCFALIDPRLRKNGRVNSSIYAEQMRKFKDVYGNVKPWHIRLSLYLDPSPRQQDKRPFAYVYVVWQDAAHGFHMFRERWIKDRGRWYTRVVGLAPNSDTATSSTT